MSRINSKIKSSKKEMEKKKEEQRKHSKVVQKLQKDFHDVTEAMRELNEQGQDGAGKLHLADSQLEEYHRMYVFCLWLLIWNRWQLNSLT